MDFDRPHRRLNPLTGQWVLVSPHRAKRPWLGQVEKVPPENLPEYDPNCYLCPGNTRSTGLVNENYTGTFVFDNDFPGLLAPSGPEEMPLRGQELPQGLFAALPEVGVCRVICFTPHHHVTLPEMPQEEVERVVRTWAEQTVEIGQRPEIGYVQVFENKGAAMGASNPHPHSQVWATGYIPNEPAAEVIQQENYRRAHDSCLLCDYLKSERVERRRIVAENDTFTALSPFWGIWPFEVMLISHRHIGSLPELEANEVAGLADIIHQVTVRYDNLFEISFPYSMGFHQTPCDGGKYLGWHLHAHYYPPLLRSATVRKFMVGFEMLGMPQRDLTPETAAERLRSMSSLHYKSWNQ